jgi:Rrf2 family iron-sulfur cluster assembly transcriptional regulator
MRLSTKGRYAVEAMMDLALHNEKGPMTLADISVDQGISLSYLEQLFARLRAEGLVQGTRGPGGGYRLARPAREISVADIVTAVDDKAQPDGDAPATHGESDPDYVTHKLWNGLSRRIFGFLAGISLAELVEERSLEIARQAGAHLHSETMPGSKSAA